LRTGNSGEKDGGDDNFHVLRRKTNLMGTKTLPKRKDHSSRDAGNQAEQESRAGEEFIVNLK
jgi:hypothetical protein